ncbi:MAG: heme o synthase [Acidimicrobiales bacterium]
MHHDGSVAARGTVGPHPSLLDWLKLHGGERPAQGTQQLGNRIKAYVALTKPRIIELLLITTVPTMFVAAKGVPAIRLIVLTVLGGALAAGGANAMNMVYDRDIDAMMERTKHRPLVTGVISPRAAVAFAFLLEAAAFSLLASTVNLLSAVLAVSATAFYVGVYTMWLKRSSPQNIVIGGAAGAVPVLVGWSAVTGRLSLVPFLMFGLIFLWTPPHFWALAVRYRDDYSAARVPMLPSIADMAKVTRQILCYTIALVALSFVLVPVAHLGLIYAAAAVVFGVAFVLYAVGLWRDPRPGRAMKLFGFSITYLTGVFVAMGVDAIAHPW